MDRELKRQLLVGPGAQDLGHRQTHCFEIQVCHRVAVGSQVARGCLVEEHLAGEGGVMDLQVHVTAEFSRRHEREILVPRRAQRADRLASPGQEIHRKLHSPAPLPRAPLDEWAVIRTRALGSHGDNRARCARHHLLQCAGGFCNRRQRHLHIRSDILFGDQAIVVTRPAEHKGIVHVREHHPIHGNPRCSQNQRLKSNVWKLLRLHGG